MKCMLVHPRSGRMGCRRICRNGPAKQSLIPLIPGFLDSRIPRWRGGVVDSPVTAGQTRTGPAKKESGILLEGLGNSDDSFGNKRRGGRGPQFFGNRVLNLI